MFKKIILYLLVFYTLLGFVVIPLVLKPQVISIVEQETNAKIEIESLYFNPYRFLLTVNGLKVSSLDDKELIHINSVELNAEVFSLFKGAIHIDSFVLENPQISLVLDKDKNINLMSIVKESKPKVEVKTDTQKTEIPRIILDRIAIVQGSLNYEDYSNKSKFEFALDDIGFELRDIDTKTIEQSDAKLRFYMKLADGGFIDLKSEVLGVEPLVVKGTLEYEASKLYTQWRYVKDKLHLEVADGKLSLETEYYFNLDDLPSTTLSHLNVNLDGLRIKPKGGTQDVLTLKSLHLKDATVKPLAQSVEVEEIALNFLSIRAKRDSKGFIDWLDYIKVESSAPMEVDAEQTSEVKNVPPWNVLVKKISLEKIQVDFQDAGVSPNVNTMLNDFNLYAQNVTLEGTKPLAYQMNLRMNDSFKCIVEGSLIHKVLDAEASVKCNDFDVEHYVAYIDEIAKKELKVYDVKLRSLIAGFDANLSVKDINSSIVIDVSDANIKLDKFAINQKSKNRRLATFSSFTANGIALNTGTKEVFVKDTSLNYLHLRTARLKDGSISLEKLVVPKKSKKKAVSKFKKEKDFRIRLKKVALKGAKVSFEDKMLDPSVKSKIDRIYLSAKNIDSKKYSWMNYYLSARVNDGGKIKTSGALRHSPLKQKGKFEIDKISLKEITPYLQESAYVELEDGFVSLKTKTSYAASKTKPDLNVNGSFKLEDIAINDSRDNSSLVSFSNLHLKEFSLETSPKRLFVNEIDIDTFYVRAAIDENKSMNLSQLMKSTDDSNLSQDSNLTKEEAFPVKIVKINVKNGRATFSDASLPIHFKTDMHNLNGDIYGVSSSPQETTFIDIAGDIDEYGSTKLKGSVKSANPKAFTDLAFNFRNLDLSAMSGYSATFAGYEIDDGKLFLNLNYDIKDSQLLGENSIIVKNIKLGKEVDIEGGSLPLGFVIALLEDSDGIIDIDMPIRGNVDEPDFKYGALAWKTFGNLILKAVTSPFRFLGSMLGIGGDELEFAEFEGGSSTILPSEREKLDNVSKLMIKRPKIILSIAGGYNAEIDKKALQKEKLIALVVKRSGAKNEEEKVSAMTADLLEDIYKDARDDDKLDKLEEELEKTYKDEALKQAYFFRTH
ncbi:MAG: DUF748 domain-containing protein [Sulfurimonas sp.]|nr:DUF748 domain-containing protein [Sulfurimonas sp.]